MEASDVLMMEVADPLCKDHDRVFCILDKTGDTRITWDSRNVEEVDNARSTFDRMRGKGYLAYKVNPTDGTKGEMITAFDASAEKVIFAPPLKGG